MNYSDRADEVYEEMRDEAWMSPHVEVVELPRYKQNLRLEKVAYKYGACVYKVYSYDTLVAESFNGISLVQHDWSHVTKATATTQKHINYVANHLGLKVVKLADLQ
jgi:CRISPR/Cas system-associated exonuclease Cas4 (RecB family)